jgi:nucleotide-binding universal stress UspA family protein
MAYKDILVHIDSSEQSHARLEMAAQIAIQQKAHLTGLYVLPNLYVPAFQDMAQLPPEYIEQQTEIAEENAKKAELDFNDVVTKAGIAHEWRKDEGVPVDVIRLHSKYSDLIILGQRNPNNTESFGDLPDGVILSVGRPVLIVPYATNVTNIGERVMVGWDASAQSARAVHDAIPFMSEAKKVDIIAVNPNKRSGFSDGHGDTPCADISLHLARHGINVEAQSITVDDIGIADILLSRAADKGVDLFVMGAYGHSRWRELVLGGVTAHMLDHMTMPVLMAH